MEFFKPELSLHQQTSGRYTLTSVTLTPSTCFYAGPARVGAPPGVVVIPEVLPVTLELRLRKGPICLRAITPVDHTLRNLELGPEHGKTAVTAFTVFEGVVVGSSTIDVRGGAAEAAAPAAYAKGAGEPTCPLGSRDWYAWDNRMPGAKPSLHVIGQVLAPTPCYQVSLKPAQPQGINPKQLILEVSLTPVPVPCPDVLTWLPAEYVEDPYDGRYDEVAIRCGGEIYAVVPIEIVE